MGLALLVASTVQAPRAGADAPKGTAHATAEGARVVVAADGGGAGSTSAEGRSSTGHRAGRSGRGASTVTCTDHGILAAGFLAGLDAALGGSRNSTTDASVAWRICTDSATGATSTHLVGLLAASPSSSRGLPPAPPPAELVAALAAADLRLAEPSVATAPPRTGTSLAGVRTWVWATDARPETATAALPGLAATVTARPVGLAVRPEGLDAVACAGPGAPPPAPTTEACTFVPPRRAILRVEVTLRWSLRWDATDGTSGTLPDTARSTVIELPVSDGVALTD